MLNLATHRQDEEDDPVYNQDGPEDWDIEHGEPAAYEADGDGAGGRVPELEFGETADEGPELVVRFAGEAGAGIAVFETLILGEGRVEFGSQEGEEQVQEVDAECVGDCLDKILC